MRRIVTGLPLLLLVSVMILAACGPKPPTAEPEVAAEAFLQAMGTRDYAAAYKLLSLDTKATVTEEIFQDMMTRAWLDSGITGFQVKHVDKAVLSKSGTRASVPYQATLETDTGSTDVFNALSLVQQDGQWLVVWPPAR